MSNYKIYLVFLISTGLFATPKPSRKLPELQHLTPHATGSVPDSTFITTLDSARFVQPPLRTTLTGTTVPIEIVPRCPVDSVVIFVRHSSDITDTLAHLYRPPFRTEWNITHVPDQDQLHLQFGYRLYHPGGKIITSKPLPHQWAINRSDKRSRKKYHCRQIVPPDTVIIDGKLDEWKHTRKARIGTHGRFAFRWTSSFLYFAAEVTSANVTPSDIIEVHLDPYLTRGTFSDERHRSIRFGPRSRSFCFVAGKKDDLYKQCDSIVALLGEGLSWRTVVGAAGYTIEAAIPFYALSDRDFPPLRIGGDVTIRTGTGKSAVYDSWTGSSEFNRYNPGKWGTIILHQAMLPLKIFILISGGIIGLLCCTIVIIVLRHLISSERIERRELRGGSQQFRAVSTCIRNLLSDATLSINRVAEETGMTAESISEVLHRELECSFDDFLCSQRVAEVKRLLWDFNLSTAEIAVRCGFGTPENMSECFFKLQRTDPESFRLKIKDLAADDDAQPEEEKS